MKMYWVYILYSEKYDRYYVGISENILRRLNEHNKGKVKSTRLYTPWRILYREEYKTRTEARAREKYLKSAAGRRWRNLNLGH